jgi:CheY-like chemotaxis protein
VVVDVGATQSLDAAIIDRLKSAIARRDLALIFLIPAGQVELVEQCRQLGLAHCLVKPIKSAELAKIVGSALGESSSTAAADDAAKPATATRPLRILVADDSPFNQQVAAGLLELGGHSVQLAADGREAVEMFKQEPFDFIFMDVEMPEIDGLAATQLIRELEKAGGTHIPIVGLSAHALVGFRERCLAAGMDAYITKPIQTDELFGALALAPPAAPTGGVAPAVETVAGNKTGTGQTDLQPIS